MRQALSIVQFDEPAGSEAINESLIERMTGQRASIPCRTQARRYTRVLSKKHVQLGGSGHVLKTSPCTAAGNLLGERDLLLKFALKLALRSVYDQSTDRPRKR